MRWLFLVGALGWLCVGCDDDGGLDHDFCHGVADGTRCDDGSECTVGDRCGGGVCRGRPVTDEAVCDDGDRCTSGDRCQAGRCVGRPLDCDHLSDGCALGICAPETGACTTEARPDGLVCDDADACTEGERCLEGRCLGAAITCPDPGQCHTGTCDPLVGCVRHSMPDDAPCDDGDACLVGERCVAGVCEAARDACYCQGRPNGIPCDDGDPCTLNDRCSAGECRGDDRECGDLDQCNVGVCDRETGRCATEPAPAGLDCDDGDACTIVDVCDEGVCRGTETCFCRDRPDGTPCDDDRACTLGDACRDGRCEGSPRDCAALDGLCVVGACLPDTGECIAQPLPLGTPCDDDDACTADDACAFGACLGRPMDCAHLDGACGVGACADGVCGVAPAPDGAGCDDGDGCTHPDACLAGECVGRGDRCGPCVGAAVGAACDDGDLCTGDTTCQRVGDHLECRGASVACAASEDACVVNVCDPESGACGPRPQPEGTPCDDGQACTDRDACADGICVGVPVPLCGAADALCEPIQENDGWQTALPLPLVDGRVTAMGRLEPAGESDWYAVEVGAGQHITAITSPHCGSVADTLIGVYLPDGETLLAPIADDAADGVPWARVEGLVAPRAGTYFVAVGSFAAGGPSTYLLDVNVSDPPPCLADLDCGCPERRCVEQACVPAVPLAGDALALDTEVLASIDAPGGEGWFDLPLDAGAPVSLWTRAFCDSALDPELSVFSPDGRRALVADRDGGEGRHAAITGFAAPADGVYRVRVRGEEASDGAYVLGARDERCAADADCGCADQICDALSRTCQPARPSPDAEGPAALPLGERRHGRIAPAFDHDLYTVALDGGRYDLRTEAFCGEPVDTRLELFDAGGEALAFDEDGGEGRAAALLGLELEGGTYTVRVSAYGASTGDYLITVDAALAP